MLQLQHYRDQVGGWPKEGRHILAQFDDETIIVYQAFRSEIARYAIAHRSLGGDAFSYGRMSWIKPNFLWMMYRSGWGTKPNQESVLALRLTRDFFDGLLACAVLSGFDARRHSSREDWETAVANSNVRLQWDPDHDPHGVAQSRRALQLGLRGEALASFGKRELLEVIDISPFIADQRALLPNGLIDLQMPMERAYRPGSEAAAANVGLAARPEICSS